jgi:tetratricopeptide (TPR) repeat protein
MAVEGSLEDVSLADICQLLSMGRKTGCLSITDRSRFGYIYFDGGRVTYASVLNRPDRLGELLVRNGVITRDQLAAAMDRQANHPGKRLGQILVDSGVLSQDDLRRFITIQIEEAVYHLFSWNQGAFHFDPDQQPEDDQLGLSIHAESLLLEGARRVDEWSLIEKKIPSMDLIFGVERDPRGEEGVELTTEQEKILPFLDGTRTVEQLMEQSGLVEFDVAKALYGLVQAGFAQRVGRGGMKGEESPPEETQSLSHLALGTAFYRAGMLEDAEREVRRALENDPRSSSARFRLALVLLRGSRAAEVLEMLDAAPEGVVEGYGALRARALSLELLGRYREALAVIEEAEQLRPGNQDLMLNRGIVLLKAQEPVRAAQALATYRAVMGRQIPPPLYYAYAVLALGMAGDAEGAVTMGREGLTHYPGEGSILVNLGAILERRGEIEAAEALYLRAAGQSPPPPQAHKNLGDLAYRRGDHAGARAHFEKAVQLEPRLGDDVYLKLGNIAYKEADRDWALLLWRRALELNPRNEVVRTNLELLSSGPGG